MDQHPSAQIALTLIALLMAAGCQSSDQRLADFAARATAEQARQNGRMADSRRPSADKAKNSQRPPTRWFRATLRRVAISSSPKKSCSSRFTPSDWASTGSERNCTPTASRWRQRRIGNH